MGYLGDYEHDIFVSYAHSELNDWSKRLVKDLRKLVATGLGLREASEVDPWMDYRISGNEPLTAQLRDKVARSGLLLVLMSEWYLKSSWCRDELEWFGEAVRQKRSGHPVFVVRVRPTDPAAWPGVFKEEGGLVGYDFVRDIEDDALQLPKGYPRPEDASDSKEYYEVLGRLAGDIVAELRKLGPSVPTASPPVTTKSARERICLAAAPVEDVDDLREELALLLRARGCTVVPETNPLHSDELHERAPEWIANCDKFVQILGSVSGAWRHDDAGLVMYQHELAKKAAKPIFVYLAPSVDASRIKKREYAEFVERFKQDNVGELQSFAEQVTKTARTPPEDGKPGVFIMASPRDEGLAREVRQMASDLKFSVFPLPRRGGMREVSSVLDETSSFLDIIRRCRGILLINGNVKEENRLWIDGRVADIEFDIRPKLGGHPPWAVVDAPPDPRLEPCEEICVLAGDSPTFRNDLQAWLQTLGGATDCLR